MEFNRDSLKALRMELSKVLTQFGIDKGIVLELGNISYDNERFTGKITGYAGDKADVLNKKFVDAFTMYAKMYDVNENIKPGTTVISNGIAYQVIGLDISKPKNCVILKNMKNNKYANTTIENINSLYGKTQKFNEVFVEM